MHIAKKFQQHDNEKLLSLINEYPFSTLVTHSAEGVEANHLPMILTETNGKKVLQAHIAKANPLWKTIENNTSVLVIFNGPNCYISPNYYLTKKENGKAVPTWNYVVVHVKGKITFIQDKDWLKTFINNLTNKHEASQDKPWSTADAPIGYVEKMFPAIVGIEIGIDSMSGQWKLSQNQPDINQQGVIQGLMQGQESDAQKIAMLIQSADG